MSKVTDDELIVALENIDTPVASSKDIANTFDLTRQAIHKRLTQLHEEGAIEREEIGSSVGWYLPFSEPKQRPVPVPQVTPQHHPYHPDVVTDVTDRYNVTEEHLTDLLGACTRIMASDSEELIETYTAKYSDTSDIDNPIIAEYPDRLTIFADSGPLYETIDGLRITNEAHSTSIIDAALRQAEHEGVEWPEPRRDYFALTLWQPFVWTSIRGGLTVPEARAMALRYEEYTPEEIRQELRVGKDEVVSLLDEASEKIHKATLLAKTTKELTDESNA